MNRFQLKTVLNITAERNHFLEFLYFLSKLVCSVEYNNTKKINKRKKKIERVHTLKFSLCKFNS